jgi:hypothetical protein
MLDQTIGYNKTYPWPELIKHHAMKTYRGVEL